MEEYAAEVTSPARRPAHYPKVVAADVDDIWGLDLADMSEWHESNDGNKFILVIVDVFSRYAWCVPMLNKTAAVAWTALSRVLSDHRVNKIWVDQGTEFYNKIWTAHLKKLKMKRYSTYGDSKVAIVERFIRTLKTRIWRHFITTGKRKWIDALPGIVATYNATIHSSLAGLTPTQARQPINKAKILALNPPPRLGVPKYQLGQWVRISRIKGTFEKGFHPSFSFEIFEIVGIDPSFPVRYYLRDYYGEDVHGCFYESMMRPVSDPTLFPVEKVLERRVKDGEEEGLAKFVGYEKPRWMPASALTDI